MEWFLSLFIFHDTLIVSMLVVGITIVVVLLLIMSQKSPESALKSELGGGSDQNVESALRRVLGEQRWLQAGASQGGEVTLDSEKLSALEMEVLEKDRKIAELNKQLTQNPGREGGGGSASDDSELLEKIAELEGRLQEYEIIEDDIADLSLYKTENEKLKEELEKLKAQLGGAVAPDAQADPPAAVEEAAPIDEPEPTRVPESPAAKEPPPAESVDEDEGEDEGVDGADLVAEFEKVVNSQSELSTDEPAEEESSRQRMEKQEDKGKVVMADEMSGQRKTDEQVPDQVTEPAKAEAEPIPVHPKLEKVNPDSKEEAEVFITELKSLRAEKKKSEGS